MVNTDWIKKLALPIAVIGLGKSGTSALKLLKAVGFADSDIITYDDKDPAAQIAKPESLAFKNPKTLVVSPGVPLHLDWIKNLIANGAFVTSEISLAASIISSEKIIGVTGSVGKTTVVSILNAGARQQDPHCFVGGNIGTPFCEYALHILLGNPRASWIVLELSSFQLENCRGLKLNYSAVTFLSDNHLERYDSLEHYYNTKLAITTLTDSMCVFNQASLDCVVYSERSKCAYYLASASNDLSQSERLKIKLIGAHNHDNFAVAHKLAKLADWSSASVEKMYHFSGLSHRLESVGTFGGVHFINDSKATAIDSVLVAVGGCLEKITTPKKLILMLGGKDKNLPWQNLSFLKTDQRIEFVFFGACGAHAQLTSKLPGPVFLNLSQALQYCLKTARIGDTILLSPGGTSLDEFKNFEERGDFFKKAAQAFTN